jgi:putative heme-binding domain-containing protein
MAALSMLAELDLPEDASAALLASVLEGGAIEEQQTAFALLGELGGASAAEVLATQLGRLAAGSLPPELALDLIQAAENSGSANVTTRLAEYRATRPANDPVAANSELLRGGNADRGEDVFEDNPAAGCVRCHSAGAESSDVGPDLAGVAARLDRNGLLQALMDPSARLAPGFGSVTLTLRNGQTVSGILQQETAVNLVVNVAGAQTVTIPRADVATRANSPSAMPAMGNILSRSEIRDLVEYLSTLR